MAAMRRPRSVVARRRARAGGEAEAGQAGFAVGPRSEKRGHGPVTCFSFLFFFEFFFFLNLFSNPFLTKIKSFYEFGPKVRVVSNFILYNFALRCKSKFQINF